MSLPAVVLAGGLATRLRPVTASIPKLLVEVAGVPFAVQQIKLLRRHGFLDITFLTGHLGEMIEQALGTGDRWNVRLRYIPDGPRALGTGGAIARALPQLGDPFFVLYGDSYLDCDYRAIEAAFIESGKSGLMTVCRNDDQWDRSNVLFTDGHIVRYDKNDRTADMRHIDYGLGAFRKSAFAHRGSNESFDLVTIYQKLLNHDDLFGYEVSGRFYEVGSPEGLADTRAYLTAKRGGSP